MKSKLLLLITPLIIFSCNKPKTEFTVTCDVEGVTLTNTKALIGQNFQTIINVNQDKINEFYSIPQTLTKITSGKTEISDYIYTPIESAFSADLFIPKESITGDITIEFSLVKLTSLCFTAVEDSIIDYEIKLKDVKSTPLDIDIQTSPDEITWTPWVENNEIELPKGEKLYIRNNKDKLSLTDTDYFHFLMSGSVIATGNAESMINNKPLSEHCFCSLFDGCDALVSTPTLPATTLEIGCYDSMFANCTNLLYPPFLPSSDLKPYCYSAMFQNCKNLFVNKESGIKILDFSSIPLSVDISECVIDMFGTDTFMNNYAPDPQAGDIFYYTVPTAISHELKFDGIHCLMKDEQEKTITKIDFNYGDVAKFHLVGETADYKIPLENTVEIKNTHTGRDFTGEWSYNQNTGDIQITVTEDVTISAVSDPVIPVPWYINDSYINSLDDSDVGNEINYLSINGKNHKVRLIGVDVDYSDDAHQNKIHTTWEFADLISDAEGYCLATQWNDTNDTSTANHNYYNSSVRKALVGEGGGHIMWGRYNETTWSDDYKTSVLDMIETGNSGFRDAIKAPSKFINIYDDDVWGEETIKDKLFLLSPREMGYDDSDQEPSTSVYPYYEGHSGHTETIRVKNQINKTEFEMSVTTIPYSESSDQQYKSDVASYAGVNYYASEQANGGGYYWLRSPIKSESTKAWCSQDFGYVTDTTTYIEALCIAPAFCI